MIPLLVVGTISFLHLAILFDPFLKRTESISARLMHTIYQYLLGFASMNFKKPSVCRGLDIFHLFRASFLGLLVSSLKGRRS